MFFYSVQREVLWLYLCSGAASCIPDAQLVPIQREGAVLVTARHLGEALRQPGLKQTLFADDLVVFAPCPRTTVALAFHPTTGRRRMLGVRPYLLTARGSGTKPPAAEPAQGASWEVQRERCHRGNSVAADGSPRGTSAAAAALRSHPRAAGRGGLPGRRPRAAQLSR